jgi:phenylacetate-CoA ligase
VQDLSPRPGELEPIETASADELRALQLQRLRWTVRHAYDNVPQYRASFDAAGVHPDDIKDLADLAKLPFTAKADLRANYPFGMFAVPREQVIRLHASSGTTGKPTVVGYTRDDIDTWATVAARSIRAGEPATSSTTPTATACSPGALACTTAPRSSAARWCRSPAG